MSGEKVRRYVRKNVRRYCQKMLSEDMSEKVSERLWEDMGMSEDIKKLRQRRRAARQWTCTAYNTKMIAIELHFWDWWDYSKLLFEKNISKGARQQKKKLYCQKICQKKCQTECQETMSEKMWENMWDEISEEMPERTSEDMSEDMSGDTSICGILDSTTNTANLGNPKQPSPWPHTAPDHRSSQVIAFVYVRFGEEFHSPEKFDVFSTKTGSLIFLFIWSAI